MSNGAFLSYLLATFCESLIYMFIVYLNEFLLHLKFEDEEKLEPRS